MNEQPLISVIIPVYNVEAYLRQCLDSVINQSYRNLEIICVEDCSTDNSLEILKEYAQKDSRIKVLQNKKNMGLGLTRNEGIKIAKGEYIHFLDSDDWIKSTLYEKFVDLILKHGDLDVFRFGSICFDETKQKYFDNYYLPDYIKNKIVNINTNPEFLTYWEPSAWAKIINTDFIRKNNLYYNNYRCLEDIEYSLYLAVKAETIYYSPETLLVYRKNRKNSLMEKRLDFLENIIKDTETAISLSKNLSESGQNYLLNFIYFHLISNTLDCYYFSKINFQHLKEIFIKYIDINELSKYEQHKYFVGIYYKILQYNEIHFKISYCLRTYFKRNFPKFVNTYFMLKRVLKMR